MCNGITTQLYTAHGGLGTRRPVFSACMRHHIIAASRADANKIFQFENRRDLRKNRLERDTHFQGRNLTIIIFVARRDPIPAGPTTTAKYRERGFIRPGP